MDRQTMNRREFLAAGASGAAAIRLAAMPGAAAPQGTPSTYQGGWTPPSDDERLALIAEAKFGPKKPASGNSGMVITSHPLVSRIAADILRLGGNAADAYMAAALSQTVLEPHMTTITGFFGLTYYDAARNSVRSIDGIANVPFKALPYSPVHMSDGRSAVVPGWWAGFELALETFGSMPKSVLMQPAIHYARTGYEAHPFLWGEIFAMVGSVGRTEQGREIYMPDGYLPQPGTRIVMQRAADTLERLRDEGNDYFYHGEFAQNFCEVVRANKGVVTPEDFAAYEARLTEPARGTYRDIDLYGSPLPGGGGMVLMLNMLELIDIQRLGPPTDSAVTLYKMLQITAEGRRERSRWRQADSHEYPSEVLLSKEYAEMRLRTMEAEDIVQRSTKMHEDSNHIAVVDADGNVATGLHTSGALPWRNGLFVDGISISASGFFGDKPRGGHRQRSTISENMFFKNGRPALACGSPSVGLAENVVQNVVNIFDFGIPIAEAVNRPRFGGGSYDLPGYTMIESDMNPAGRVLAEKKGAKLDVVNPWNWHHGSFDGIFIDENGRRHACGDPRRNAMAMTA